MTAQEAIRTQFLRRSSAVAGSIQRQLGALPGTSRGVKQAPFVVLMGVNMPAALLEVGFLTNAEEERRLAGRKHQDAIARAIRGAVEEYGRERAAPLDDAALRERP